MILASDTNRHDALILRHGNGQHLRIRQTDIFRGADIMRGRENRLSPRARAGQIENRRSDRFPHRFNEALILHMVSHHYHTPELRLQAVFDYVTVNLMLPSSRAMCE
jgi:hypothetical protein